MKRRNSQANVCVSLLIGLVLSCAGAMSALAQDAATNRGFQPGNSYTISDIESLNMVSGNVGLRFPLATLPVGRGGLTASINLLYNSKLYDSEVAYFPDENQPCEIAGEPPEGGVESCPYYQKRLLKPAEEGGWRYGMSYTLKLIDRHDNFIGLPPNIAPQCSGSGYFDLRYRYKLILSFPDGSTHEMRPNGWSDGNANDPLADFFDIRPDGLWENCVNPTWYTNTITYFSTDGTFLRLDIQHDSDSAWWNNPWTLYFPDGSKVTGGNEPQRIYDRNNNYVQINFIENYNGTGFVASQIVDQMNRSITLTSDGAEDLIISQGFGGTYTWKVRSKLIRVQKSYWPCNQSLGCPPEVPQQELYANVLGMVDRITLPSQAGSLTYNFTYNAPFYTYPDPYTNSVGWGELSGITLPTGAHVAYTWVEDGTQPYSATPEVLRNAPASKVLSYNHEHDGTSTPVTETWSYSFSTGGSSVTGPDGGVTTQWFVDTATPSWNSGQIIATFHPDGSKSETIRAWNDLASNFHANSFPRTEFKSIKNAAGAYVKTAIKDSSFDKNGNVTRVVEYDWIDYALVPRDPQGVPTGIPAGLTPLRVTASSYVASTPDSSQFAGSNTNVYWSSGSPRLKRAVAWSEVRNGAEQPFTRSEFTYDNALTTGNVLQQRSWDSAKGGYSNPLTTGNSISTSVQYNSFGSPILTTDARGTQTQIIYGSVGGFTDLYPTQIKTAYQTSVQRTETREYDFGTGLVTRVTDVDNNVATATTYDIFGRPTLVKSAEGKPEEARTATEYADALRRVIVRKDLSTAGDGKLVSVQHFDQLGRVRLTRQLEDSTSESATSESTGVKVQTRYLQSGSNSFQLVSNSYRAATSSAASSEPTMGWTRSKSDSTGRIVEMQTFGGAGLPAPWGTNTTSTGTATTSYDANFTTVSDQNQKQKRSLIDALGRLIRVDEPDANGVLGSPTSPNQPTHYIYDVLANLTKVTQSDGVTTQSRDFVYSSLSRLTRATNPESGQVDYKYDEAGNLTVKSDARGVSAHYAFDPLNRITRRWYNASSSTAHTTHNDPVISVTVGATDEVKFYYDAQGLPPGAPTYTRGASIGQLVAETYGSGSNGNYFAYDVLGRGTLKIQQVGTVNYQISAVYNRANATTTLTYPSGRTVNASIDAAGRLATLTGNLGDGATRTYSTGISYSATGNPAKEQFGTSTPIYNKLFYNSRGQLAEVRASTTYTGPTDYSADRGAIVNNYSDQCTGICSGSSMTDNDGNLRKQEILIPNQQMRWQQFTYDSLNRLKSAREVLNGGAEQWKQSFSYDRWGNRLIDGANTWGTGINNRAFTVTQSNNRLGVPVGQSGSMTYDASGNLINDTYTGAGNRTYDADNKITSAWGGLNQVQNYGYDGSGQRIRRTVNGVETWQVYGIDGSLLAEYPVNGATGSPQKEYGYRNGELLVTAAPGSSQSVGLNGTSSYVQVPNSSSLNITSAITVEAWVKVNAITGAYQDVVTRESYGQAGTGGGYELSITNLGKVRLDLYQGPTTYAPVIGATTMSAGAWHHIAGVFDGSQMRVYLDGVLDGTVNTTNGPASGTSSLKIGRTSGGSYFGGLIDEVRVSNAALYTSGFTPSGSLTASGSTKGLWKFDGQSTSDTSTNGNHGSLQSGAVFSADVPPSNAYYSGSFNGTSSYVQVPNSTSLNITGAITVEAWVKVNSIGAYQDIITRESYAQSGTGGGYELSVTNLGKPRFDLYQGPTSWTPVVGATTMTAGAWHHVAGVFDGSQMRIYLNGVLDGTFNTTNGPASGTSSLKLGRTSGGSYFGGLIDEARVSNAAVYTSNFTPQTHLTASGSTKGLWKFDAQSINDSSGNANHGTLQGTVYSDDVPGGGGGGGAGAGPQVNWLVSDHLGTARMIFDQTGSLANTKRHDYLPFGEELVAPTGGRTTGQGYSAGDGVRQQFAEKERDTETGLDYFGARYYSSIQGRFVSPDPLLSSGRQMHPQSWNRYSYVMNEPLSLTDPSGMDWGVAKYFDKENNQWVYHYHYFTGEIGEYAGHKFEAVNFGGDDTRTLNFADGRTMAISNNADVLGGRYMAEVKPRVNLNLEAVLPPSPLDYVPFAGNARKFLFNYHQQNFEGALLNFVGMATDLYSLGAGAGAGIAKSFATKPGEAIFYSGKGALDLAKTAAQNEGGKIMAQTFGGKVLNLIPQRTPSFIKDPIMNWGSKQFANGASGTVRAFIREPVRHYSTWRQVEYPILRNNPFVNLILR